MKNKILSVLAVALLAGCAGSSNMVIEQRENQSGIKIESAKAITKVPSIKVEYHCGPCVVPESMKESIVNGYLMQAKQNDMPVDEANVLVFKLRQYKARDPGARFFLGAFAGKDVMAGDVEYRGRTFEVEDYHYNAILPMSVLARSIGVKAYNALYTR